MHVMTMFKSEYSQPRLDENRIRNYLDHQILESKYQALSFSLNWIKMGKI